MDSEFWGQTWPTQVYIPDWDWDPSSFSKVSNQIYTFH